MDGLFWAALPIAIMFGLLILLLILQVIKFAVSINRDTHSGQLQCLMAVMLAGIVYHTIGALEGRQGDAVGDLLYFVMPFVCIPRWYIAGLQIATLFVVTDACIEIL